MQQQPGQNMAQAPISTLPIQPTLSSKQQQSQSVHSTFHQINHQKSFNVVSLIKSTTTHQITGQQHQHHHQSQQQQQLQNQQQSHHHSQTYNNILNRAVPPAPTASAQPIICQINSSENSTGNVYALNQRIMKNLETNGGSGSATAAGNGGIVGLNVGCIDNRKYEYKNKLLNNNFQAAQEYNPSTGGSLNASGTVRASQQTGPIFRAQAPNSVPRNTGTRHIQNNVPIPTMYQQTMPQNMMMSNFSYQPRQTTFQTQQFAFPQAALQHYYPISYFHPQQLSQAQLHQRTAVGVATNGTVSVNNAISAVQTGPNGPLAGPASSAAQAQVPMAAGTVISSGVPPPGSNAVLGVGNPNSATQVGVGVNVSPMVAVVPPVSTQPTQPTKPRPNALPIINPITNKSIFEDFDVSNRSSNSESEYQEPPVTIQTDPNLPYPLETIQQKQDFSNISSGSSGGVIMITPVEANRSNLSHTMDSHHTQQHREMIGQTPVVSAMSDAPSVEILPSQPKPRNKKIPIVAPKEDAINGPKEVKKEGRRDSITSSASEEIASQTTPALVEKDLVAIPTPIKAAEEVIKGKLPVHTQQQKELENTEVSSENVPLPEASVCHTKSECNRNMDISTNDLNETSLMAPKPEDETIDCATATNLHTVNYQSADVKIENNDQRHQRRIQASSINPSSTPQNDTSGNNVVSVTMEEKSHIRYDNLENSIEPAESSPSIIANTNNTDETDRATITSSILGQKSNVFVEESSSFTKEKDQRSKQIELEVESKSLKVQSESVETTDVKEAPADTMETMQESSDTTLENHIPARIQSLINYNEGQWSPHNPSGKKQYNREQLLLLREAKASRVQPEVNNSSILPQPNLMPNFARNSGSGKRIQSMVSGTGSHRGGDGGGSGSNYGNKQASMSGVNSRNSSKGVIRVNLSLNQDVKLSENDNAWRPRVLQKGDDENDPDVKSQREKEDLLRRVRGILNKLTPEKFDALVEEIIKLKIDTPDKMEAVMILVFEKAVDEPNFSVSYALLCHRLINEVKARDERMEEGTKSNLQSFRNALLDKTEREFTQNVTQSTLKQAKLQPIIEKIKECSDPIEKAELEGQLEEEELKIRRRSGGTVRFIGELFKISMLTGKIIYSCVEQLLNPKSEDMLECLCKLLTTVGSKLEKTLINSKDTNRYYSLDKVIARMQAIASKSDKEGEKISSRVRFMLQDVIDLRKNKWQSKRNEAPKTMGQIEKETKSEQLSSQYLNYGGSVSTGPSSGPGGNAMSGQMGGAGGKRGDDRGGGRYGDHRSSGGYSGSHSQRGGDTGTLRRQLGNNNSTNNGNNSNGGAGSDDTWHVQTSRGRSLALDSNKLEALISANQDMGNKKMGGMSMFVWNNQSRQMPASSSFSGSSATPSNSFAALSSLEDRGTDRDRDNDRDRDRSGPRNKGSYSKNSMERERDRDRYWNERNLRTRTGSSQISRESSSSRSGPQSGSLRSMNATTSSAVQKSASHSKYTQQMSSRMAGKPAGMAPEFSKTHSVERNQQADEFPVPSRQSQTTAQPEVFEQPTDSDMKIIKSVLTEMFEVIAFSNNSVKNAASSFERISDSQKCGFLYYILADYLHLRDVGPLQRRFLASIVAYLIENQNLTIAHFKLAYKNFCEIASELMVDIPDLWLYVFQFTGPLLTKQLITVKDLWIDCLRSDNETNIGKKFLKTFINYCTRGIGPSFTRNMWNKLALKWTDFMPESDVEDFIKTNKLSYIENESIMPYIDVRNENKDQIVEHIKHLLDEGGNADIVIDYINGNIVDIDRPFIRSLTTTLCDFAITHQDSSFKLDVNSFQKICIPILQRYIETKEERELECLYAMQLLVHRLEHPRGLLCELFAQLYDSDVIPPESFKKWQDSKDQSAGKGVAVKGLNSFFTQLLNSETSDENN